jgi:squalene synthase HpnC
LEIAGQLPADGCSLGQARQYTRWLGRSHYENFLVATWLLPRRLHQPFFNVYAYCRWADDLGDEVEDPAIALDLLNWWEEELDRALEGRPRHPVFVALAETIAEFQLPAEPFRDLLRAFRQDQTKHRYADWDEVLDYCRYSANPVGRLVLALGGYRDEQRQRLSDATCTALQLANFWQDVARDWKKGRLYIPLEKLAAFGLAESDIASGRFDERYGRLMRDLVARTQNLFEQGLPLAGTVRSELRIDIELFSRGGLAVLDAIEAAGYNTLESRPVIRRSTQMRLLGRALLGRWLGLGRGAGERAA